MVREKHLLMVKRKEKLAVCDELLTKYEDWLHVPGNVTRGV